MIVDHLVYATPDLTRGIDELEQLLGIRATPGGQHPGLGTRNALIALGADSYIEIVAPDPGQPAPSTPRWFGIDELSHSKFVTWAAKGTDLEQLHAQTRLEMGFHSARSRAEAGGARTESSSHGNSPIRARPSPMASSHSLLTGANLPTPRNRQ